MALKNDRLVVDTTSHLITGDVDLLILKYFGETKIVSFKDYLG
jgi:hypothetical protein